MSLKSDSKKPAPAETASGQPTKRPRYKSRIRPLLQNSESESVAPKPLTPEERFGEQLRKWRERAGMTANQAGNLAFNASGKIKEDSAEKNWRRYEKRVPPNLGAEEIKALCGAVGGNARLGAAILGNKFISGARSATEKPFDPAAGAAVTRSDEDGFSDHLDPYLHLEYRFAPEFKAEKKSAKQIENESLTVTREFLVNNRAAGTSIEYLAGLNNYEDAEYERNKRIEEFFKSFILRSEDPYADALRDLWLSFFHKGEAGLELLRQVIRFYESGVEENPARSDSRSGQTLVYQYAAHFATALIFNLYASVYDPLDPQSSDEKISHVNLEYYRSIENLARTVVLLREDVAEAALRRKFMIGTFKPAFRQLPKKNRSRFKKLFSRSVRALASADKILTRYLSDNKNQIRLKHDFQEAAMKCFSELYYLEKEIFYSVETTAAEEADRARRKREIFPASVESEKHPLLRFYDAAEPRDFIKKLWLMEDAFELYKIRFREIFPEREISYALSLEDVGLLNLKKKSEPGGLNY